MKRSVMQLDAPALEKFNQQINFSQTMEFEFSVVLSFYLFIYKVCDVCGHKTNEIKSGGGIEEKGKKIMLK